MKRDDSTYGSVSRRYDEWVEIQKGKPAPQRIRSDKPYVHQRHENSDMGRMVFAAIGIGIGVVLLVLSLLAFLNANWWGDFGRDSASWAGDSLVSSSSSRAWARSYPHGITTSGSSSTRRKSTTEARRRRSRAAKALTRHLCRLILRFSLTK